MPNHMPWAAIGAPYPHWMKNVNQRNAPGAMRAMALTVRPVNPSVARDVVCGFWISAIRVVSPCPLVTLLTWVDAVISQQDRDPGLDVRANDKTPWFCWC